MTVTRTAGPLLIVLVATFAGSAQQAPGPQAGAGAPPLPPPRGTLTVSADTAQAIRAALKAPAGFSVTAFAAPPVVNYPACVTATHTGVVFVCVDRNGSLQTDAGMGYIVRLVDKDEDGQADEYTMFADLDSPRGAVFDGEVLYVSHPPFLTALRDADGDGIAEDRRTLVRGLGFGLDFRGADHTTNGIELGIDGWLYVAVGDYGFVKATGADGQEIQLRGGGNVRLRPDGSELEIYSRGTRNDYDLAVDPYLNLFARGNTNDGGGFDIRMYHFVEGATFGYPTLFRNFSDEVVPPLADYGTGSGTGMLYVHDARVPAPFGDALYSVDWGRNAIFRHPLERKGSTFAVAQEPFIEVPRPTDMTIDGPGRLYVASWEGGQFRYAGEDVGWVARLTHEGVNAATPSDLAKATDATLVDILASANLVASREAQAALLRRGRTPDRVSLLERRAAAGPLHGRVAALFTLKQLAGGDAAPALMKLADDAVLRPFAIRALGDRRGEIAEAAKPLLLRGLVDQDPRTRLESVTALKRMGATDAAQAMLPLTAEGDPVIANVAINALAALGVVDAPLAAARGADDRLAAGAFQVLQRIHQPAVVTGLIATLSDRTSATRRAAILRALARLHNREGVWRGTLAEWWGTRPDTTGPYYDPVAWEESPRIRAALLHALLETAGGARQPELAALAGDLERNRVLPPGGAELLSALAADRHASLPELAGALVGRVRLDLDPPIAQLLERTARAQARYRTAVVRMVVAAGAPSPIAAPMLQAAATDAALDAELRASAVTALASATGPDALRRTLDTLAALAGPPLEPALEAAWMQVVSMPAHAANVAAFRALAEDADPGRQRVGFAVLIQLAADPPAAARGGRGGANATPAAGGGRAGGTQGRGGGRGRGGVSPEVAEQARADARTTIESAWSGPATESLVWAVGRTGAARYRDRVQALAGSAPPAVQDAATHALARLDARAPRTAPAAEAAGPVVSAVPYEELAARVADVKGDPELGRKLFVQQACSACHTTAAGEPEKGPHLGGIFTRYSAGEVLESIVRPAAKVAQGFATNVFVTTDKRQLTGFVVREGQDEVVIRDLTGAETTLRKADIASRAVNEGSTMPPGLVDTLTLHELASLLAFMQATTPK